MCCSINDCDKWCLIRCSTNITTEQYYEASNDEMCNDQTLSDASLPVAESTRLSSDFRFMDDLTVRTLTKSQVTLTTQIIHAKPLNTMLFSTLLLRSQN